MEIVDFRPDRASTRKVPFRDQLKIIPIGDLHIGADGFNLDRLARTIERGLSDGAWFLGMGDAIDFTSSSNRERLIGAGLYDTARTIIDDAADQLLDKLKAALKPSIGRWLGVLEGNHYWCFDDGITSDQSLASYLKAPFLGTCAIIQTRFHSPPRRSLTCSIWCHHGYGGGVTAGAVLAKLHRAMEATEADIYCMGHHHQLIAQKVSRLYCTSSPNPRIIEKPRLLVGTGSFMAGYEQGSRFAGRPHGSYVERRMLPPAAMGAPYITVKIQEADPQRFDLSVTT